MIPKKHFTKPHYVGMLVHIRDVVERPGVNITVYYNTIDGKDDDRELFWGSTIGAPNYKLFKQLQPGKDYAVKVEVRNDINTFKTAREIRTVKVLPV